MTRTGDIWRCLRREENLSLSPWQLFFIRFRNLRATFCSFRTSALMIMSAFSLDACSPATPFPQGFHFQMCPALFINAFTPPFFNLVRQSMEFIYESAPALGLHAYTPVEHPPRPPSSQRAFLPELTRLPSPGSSVAPELSCSWLGKLSSLLPSPPALTEGNKEGAGSQFRQMWVHWVHKLFTLCQPWLPHLESKNCNSGT